MSDYPRMLYRKGGEDDIFGLKCETKIVDSAEEEQAADGWHRSPFEAHGVEAPKPDPVEEAAPDTDEKMGLLNEIEDLRDQVRMGETALSAERDRADHAEAATKEAAAALAAVEKDLAETRDLLAEATKPADKPKGKETLSVKAG